MLKKSAFMPSLLSLAILLQAPEKEELHQLINRHSTPQQIALRASIIIWAG
jgi:hypothetical protein